MVRRTHSQMSGIKNQSRNANPAPAMVGGSSVIEWARASGIPGLTASPEPHSRAVLEQAEAIRRDRPDRTGRRVAGATSASPPSGRPLARCPADPGQSRITPVRRPNDRLPPSAAKERAGHRRKNQVVAPGRDARPSARATDDRTIAAVLTIQRPVHPKSAARRRKPATSCHRLPFGVKNPPPGAVLGVQNLPPGAILGSKTATWSHFGVQNCHKAATIRRRRGAGLRGAALDAGHTGTGRVMPPEGRKSRRTTRQSASRVRPQNSPRSASPSSRRLYTRPSPAVAVRSWTPIA